MDINFSGLVDLHSLSTSEPLLPLYEAIVNSIQSIQQRVDQKSLASIKEGTIEIIIERETRQTLLDIWETDIENIIIKDNGIGFNDDNYRSFNTYASDFKKSLGCKGVGRMIWLKAFNNVHISSTYLSRDSLQSREFDFDEENAVSGIKISTTENKDVATTVRLEGLKTKCEKTLQKSYLQSQEIYLIIAFFILSLTASPIFVKNIISSPCFFWMGVL